MNIVDLLILAVLVFGLLAGMYKGFVTSGLSTVGFVGSWFGARLVYEKVANLALGNKTLMAVLAQYLEPASFFESAAIANTSVADVVSGGESAIQSAIATAAQRIPVIAKAFEANIRNQAFSRLNISTLADYLDQTIWTAVFNVLAFLLCFIVIYAIVTLIINLLDRVICFPQLRMFDWLVGGLCGVVRALAVAVMLICLVEYILPVVSPDLASKVSGGGLYTFVKQIDFLGVAKTFKTLIGG